MSASQTAVARAKAKALKLRAQADRIENPVSIEKVSTRKKNLLRMLIATATSVAVDRGLPLLIKLFQSKVL